MNAKDLYEDNIYGNGNPTYYEDEECEIPYTGHVESFYPSGAFKAIAITYDDNLIIAYFYSEEGRVLDKSEVLERDLDILEKNPDGILNLVSLADFEKMNQEIIKFGHPLNLPKGFEFVPPEK